MYGESSSHARGTLMITVVKYGVAVFLNSTAITVLAAAFLQVDHDTALWRAIDTTDAKILLRIWTMSVVLCIAACCVLYRRSVWVSVATAWALGCILGVLVSQVSFPGNTYIANAVHFTCITVPVSVACSIISVVVVLVCKRNHKRSHPQSGAH